MADKQLIQLVDEKEASLFLGVEPQTLTKWRFRGRGPAFYKLGGAKVRYKLADLEAFVESSRVEPVRKNRERKRRKSA
jgi:hypothetical protein